MVSRIPHESNPKVATTTTPEIKWSHYHGNAQRAGRSSLDDPRKPARTRWKLKVPIDGKGAGLGDQFRTAPVVASQTAFTANKDGNLVAIDLPSGTVKWSYSPSGTVQIAPAVSNGHVFLGTSKGDIISLDQKTGKERWSLGVDNGVSTPAIQDGRVYFGYSGSETAEIVGFDTTSGDLLWRTKVPKTGSIHSPNEMTVPTPAVAGETVVANVQNMENPEDDNNVGEGGLVALNAKDGKKQWQTFLGGNSYPPSITQNSCYTIAKGRVHRMSLAGGTVRWKHNFGRTRGGSGPYRIMPDAVTIGQDAVYVQIRTGIGESGFVALNKRTGDRKWRYTVDSTSIGSGVSTTTSRVYFALQGNLVALNAETGFEEWKYQVNEKPPGGTTATKSVRMGAAPIVTPNGLLVKHLGTLYMVDDESASKFTGQTDGGDSIEPATQTGEMAPRSPSEGNDPPRDPPGVFGLRMSVINTIVTILAIIMGILELLRGGD